jgi:hypothetical protein
MAISGRFAGLFIWAFPAGRALRCNLCWASPQRIFTTIAKARPLQTIPLAQICNRLFHPLKPIHFIKQIGS